MPETGIGASNEKEIAGILINGREPESFLNLK
jgi:hypothetical protein